MQHSPPNLTETDMSTKVVERPPRRTVWMLGACLVSGACFSSGGREAIAIPPAPQAANTATMAAANQRLFAAAAVDTATSTAASTDEIQLGPQDRLTVVVFGAETFSGEFSID